MSYDGVVISGWGSLARTQEQANQIVQDLSTSSRHEPPQRVAHFVIDVDDLDQGVAFWSAALDATDEPLSEISSHVYANSDSPIPTSASCSSGPLTQDTQGADAPGSGV